MIITFSAAARQEKARKKPKKCKSHKSRPGIWYILTGKASPLVILSEAKDLSKILRRERLRMTAQ